MQKMSSRSQACAMLLVVGVSSAPRFALGVAVACAAGRPASALGDPHASKLSCWQALLMSLRVQVLVPALTPLAGSATEVSLC